MNVLITGASKGIGFELVQKFANDKLNNVVALARDLVELKNLQAICEKQFENKIDIYSIDFLSDNLETQFSELLSDLDCHFDVVVNNAGYLINKAFIEMKQNEMLNIYQINVFAPMLLVKNLIPFLDEDRSSHILNIGSMGGVSRICKVPWTFSL